MSTITKLLLGLLGVILLSLACRSCHHVGIESKLKDKVSATLTSPDFQNVNASFTGSNGVLTGTVPSKEAATKALADAQVAVGGLFPITSQLTVGGGLPTSTTL